MRMWFVDPRILCRFHLLGEHVEMHMFQGCISKKKKIKGYIDKNLCDPKLIKERHDLLATEMVARKMNHKTPIDENPDCSYLGEDKIIIDMKKSKDDLLSRCPRCRARLKILNRIKGGV